ncbi:MAG: hypothetical protein IJP45_03745 [Paludibacteraceae bacterium]|nr:hypothetical protein [Paludibacteraceae bacterium]
MRSNGTIKDRQTTEKEKAKKKRTKRKKEKEKAMPSQAIKSIIKARLGKNKLKIFNL